MTCSSNQEKTISPRAFYRLAAQLGRTLPWKDRLIFCLRPFICPFDKLYEFVPPQARLLDIGAGRGLWLFLLAKTGRIAQGCGVEIESRLVASADSLKSDKDQLTFLLRQPESIWPDDSFDCVSLIDVLHHIASGQQEAFIKSIAARNIPRVIFKDIDPRARFKAKMNTLHDMVLSGQVPCYCPPEQVAAWLEQTGFTITASGRQDRLWYSHYYLIADKANGVVDS